MIGVCLCRRTIGFETQWTRWISSASSWKECRRRVRTRIAIRRRTPTRWSQWRWTTWRGWRRSSKRLWTGNCGMNADDTSFTTTAACSTTRSTASTGCFVSCTGCVPPPWPASRKTKRATHRGLCRPPTRHYRPAERRSTATRSATTATTSSCVTSADCWTHIDFCCGVGIRGGRLATRPPPKYSIIIIKHSSLSS